MKGEMKKSARTTSKMLSLETDSGVVWGTSLSAVVDHHPMKETSHREEAEKSHVGDAVCDIHHGSIRRMAIEYTENYKPSREARGVRDSSRMLEGWAQASCNLNHSRASRALL